MLLALPGMALASHQFNDVLNGHPFHDDISAVAQAGIAAGFPDGGYHPSDPVTRQAMAAFMNRGLGHIVMDTDAFTETAEISVDALYGASGYAAVREITIEVPGVANGFGAQQWVYLLGRVLFVSSMGPSNGCPCGFQARFFDATANDYTPGTYATFYNPTATVHGYTLDVDALVLATPGPHTYQLVIGLSEREDVSNPATFPFHHWSSLSALSFPFAM